MNQVQFVQHSFTRLQLYVQPYNSPVQNLGPDKVHTVQYVNTVMYILVRHLTNMADNLNNHSRQELHNNERTT